jgi:TM2 domain-containing membrane protein YozV
MKPVEAVKRKWIATLLALFFGFAGGHRFYLGFYKMGLAQIAVTALTQGYGVLWGFIDAVLLFAGHINKDAKNRPLK